MEIIPAIDIYDGACVRLYQGNYDEVKQYHNDPVIIARQFRAAGATRIHIVDLNAARGQKGENIRSIDNIRNAIPDVKLQVGGGVRDDDTVEGLIHIGIDLLVVGTLLAHLPHIVEGWITRYGNRFIAGIDARNGVVCTDGWERKTGMNAVDVAKEAERINVESIIYTNIEHDGALNGPDIVGTLEIARAVNTPVILSGGVSSREDIDTLFERHREDIAGVILGKSLYENKINLSEVIEQYGE